MQHLALSTRWNAYRHTHGMTLCEEIAAAGFNAIEAGYDTRPELAEGLVHAVNQSIVSCRSVHNFCPVPGGVERGHPELYSLASRNPTERQLAVEHTLNSARFAAELGARFVVTHAGSIPMTPFSPKLFELHAKDKLKRFDRYKIKMMAKRNQLADQHFDELCTSLDQLLPEVAKLGVSIALENLPTPEAMPTQEEFEKLFTRFPAVRYWHDFGHERISNKVGLSLPLAIFKQYPERIAGLHIHDGEGYRDGHLMPPISQGIAWNAIKPVIKPDYVFVLEAKPDEPLESIQSAKAYFNQTWGLT